MSMSDEDLLKAMGYPVDARHRKKLAKASSEMMLSFWRAKRTPEDLKPIMENLLAAPEEEQAPQAEQQANRADEVKELKLIQWDKVKYGPHLRAPFTFVPLNETVVHADGNQALDCPRENGLSAMLKVTWRIETPLLIGAGRDNGAPFALDGKEDWAVPGASLRGAMRATLECLAHARLWQTNRSHRFALRDFEHPRYRTFISEGGVGDGDGKLKAGWLSLQEGVEEFDPENADLVITPCRGWGRVAIDRASFPLRGLSGKPWWQSDRAQKYAAPGIKDLFWNKPDGFASERAFRKGRDKHDQPFYELLPKDSTGDASGFLVFSGKATSNKKQYEYVFFEDPAARPVKLSRERWHDFFIVNSEQGDKTRKPAGAWAEFGGKIAPKQRIPVFYFGDLDTQDETFSFGLTRLYRLPHRFSIGDKLPDAHTATAPGAGREFHPDFVEALFGYVHEAEGGEGEAKAWKGRAAFGFARPVDVSDFKPTDAFTAIQGAPKPAYAPFYLVGPRKDWSDATSRLAGRKRYLPKGGAAESPRADLKAAIGRTLDDVKAAGGGGGKVGTALQFLCPTRTEAAFVGDIRLHNVSEAELGALLWCLTFGAGKDGEARRHLLGRGKPFGAGRTAVVKIESDIRRHTAPDIPEKNIWRISEAPASLSPFMVAFEDEMDTALGGPGVWRASTPVEAALDAALPCTWSDDKGHYLEFSKVAGDETKGNGWRFKELRNATGPRAKDAKGRLLTRSRATGV